MKSDIIIGSKNPYKQQRLADIVAEFYNPRVLEDLPEIEETGETFLQIAQNKALALSKKYPEPVIVTDGGAAIPALKNWNPLKTKRFHEGDDFSRIKELLEIMKDKKDRAVHWFEALAVARQGKLVFSTQVRAMDGVVDGKFDPKKYEPGIWLCSITSYPQFGGRNYFDLTKEEQSETADNWSKLKDEFAKFMRQ